MMTRISLPGMDLVCLRPCIFPARLLIRHGTPDDPENPKNWSLFKKCFVTFCICLITISVYSGSSIVSPAIMQVMEQFGVAQVPATLTLSLFVAGYGYVYSLNVLSPSSQSNTV